MLPDFVLKSWILSGGPSCRRCHLYKSYTIWQCLLCRTFWWHKSIQQEVDPVRG